MLDQKHRRPYWLETRMLVVWLMMPGVFLVLGTILFWGRLNGFSFIGFPLGYFLLTHGFMVLGFVVVAWHSVSQAQIDRRHGIHEES